MKIHICFAQVHFIMRNLTHKKKIKSSAHRISHIASNKRENQNQFGIFKEEIQIQL